MSYYGDGCLTYGFSSLTVQGSEFGVGDVCRICLLWKLVDYDTAEVRGSTATADGVYVTLQDASGRQARIHYGSSQTGGQACAVETTYETTPPYMNTIGSGLRIIQSRC